MVLDAIGDTVEVKSFDTEKVSEGVAMAKFLNDIPEEHIALIAVQDTSGESEVFIGGTMYEEMVNLLFHH